MIATLLNNTLLPQNISLLYNSVCVCVCVCTNAFKLTPAFVFTNLLVAIFLKAVTFFASGKAGKAISHKIYALRAGAVSHIFKNIGFAVPGIAHILQNIGFPSCPNGHILQNMRFPSYPNGHILQNMSFPSCPNEHILQNKWALIRNYSSTSIKTNKNHQH